MTAFAATTDESADDAASDEALAGRAATDRTAFEALYLRHRLALYRYARARAGDDEDAADIVATTFERALAGIAGFRPIGGGFRAWLFRIARNEVVDTARRRRTADRHAPRLAVVVPDDPPETALIRAEDLHRARALVAALPDTQRDALLLRYAGGLSAREIAVTMGRSEAAVQKLMSRALAGLQEAFRADDR